MATLSPDEALERARAAAEAARLAADQAAEAAKAAGSIVDQLAGAAHNGLDDGIGAAVHSMSGGAIDPFVFRLSIFVLAIFVGYYVVWSVTPALHTPLMSVTNAISSVIIVGALLAVGVDLSTSASAGMARGFGFVAVILAAVNIFGGFLVTSRMLAMYKKKG
ncbi:NAD(P) transhydrogenase subunit alpha [Hartmannibacter diazotrophicus]|uniref:proton-translocating NAD(P)(+) transhydrogenase n=1 Tax=Hartmannibacter diazotrophicus TaxID=1482074 RepID=A0A2C9DD77_9HYPH|nr:NAD(P) transhydrogenase subunit alpha [Hartmannibacter diazotrophicus]SON57212.1 NAD(P) transhydrogenase subunit alpha [Hartmannibacter diazotrophicus]SON57701.1 NAD(P) transhydrogenase subunit alpha [Hartmannibacter diazotrophicus]